MTPERIGGAAGTVGDSEPRSLRRQRQMVDVLDATGPSTPQKRVFRQVFLGSLAYADKTGRPSVFDPGFGPIV